MLLYILDKLIVLIHLVVIFFPLTLFVMKFPRWLYKYFILIPVLIIIHWKFLDNQCSLTILQRIIKNKKNNDRTGFSERHLKWFYNFFLNLFNLPWNENNLVVAINIHWLVNFLIIWYFTFF